MYNVFKKIKNKYKNLKITDHAQEERYIFGFVDEINSMYASGWVCDVNHIDQRLVCEAIISDTNEVLAVMKADLLHHADISSVGDGKGYYAFWAKFSRKLNIDEQAKVVIRIQKTNEVIPFSPVIRNVFQPFGNFSMDIVNNCNLRCPFCLYDYSSTKKTYFMSDETFSRMLEFLPYVQDGEFWFSCLHEPALHPKFEEFLKKIPHEYRKKISFTTNLAKKMPDSYFEFLATSNVDHINISIESFVPEHYMKFRKGARYTIFIDNLNKLVQALTSHHSDTRLNYIAMAYKTNFKEFPDMYHDLMNTYKGAYFEMRDTFDLPFIDGDFKKEEFLSVTEWDWLEDQFKQINDNRVVLYRSFRDGNDDNSLQEIKKEPEQQEKKLVLKRQYTLRVSWDGKIQAFAKIAPGLMDEKIFEVNVNTIKNPEEFYNQLLIIDYI